jgi:dihydrofolate synthase / folylpolyglutamate synthase
LSERWSEMRAERHLRSLELFGMRFGLDRMRRMMTVLGAPQLSFRSVHVVGTNGKSSTTRMIAAILQRHGLHTGAYLSPHLTHYRERVQVGERDLETHEFAAAVARAAWAAERVNKTLAQDDHVTQFELLTAAALWAMAQRGVEVAVIEAGLGGRYDATSVIESSVSVLTNVSLEHTRWLGPTIADIAKEKLAVLRPATEIVLGAGATEEVVALARDVACAREAELRQAGALPRQPGLRIAAAGGFQRANFALAELAAERFLASIGLELQARAVAQAALCTTVPGRLQTIGREPLTLLDGAHNADATRVLVSSLAEMLGDRPLALVMGVLEDKDAAAMLRHLLPMVERAWFTAPASTRALPPATLQSLARQIGFDASECESHPSAALAAAQRWARRVPAGAVLATGSVYLVGALLEQLHDGQLDERGGSDRRLREGQER